MEDKNMQVNPIIDYSLSEEDTKNRYITPAIEKAGWQKINYRMEVPIKAGKILDDKGHRKPREFADYVLYDRSKANNWPIAVIEAKKISCNLGDGRQQAVEYAEKLGARFAFYTNGKDFGKVDLEAKNHPGLKAEETFSMDEFPSLQEMIKQYEDGLEGDNIQEVKKVINTPLARIGEKEPRAYQTLAINKTIEAIANGKKRALLVLATGTGKTYVASQICYKLHTSGLVHKILYLADRNILINQTITGDFQPFAKISTTIHKSCDVSKMKAYDLFFALYQGLTDKKNAEEENVDALRYIKDVFPKDYFDLIIVDECHRGSSRADSQWREILDYFSSAIQIGMTATPKETKEVSNIQYFGEPLVTYKLNDGINDGYLAPYKVLRINIDIDVDGYRPEDGKTDVEGNLIPDQIYTSRDFDRIIVINDRTKLVAKRITKFLQDNDPMAKTIVFCEDIDHAEAMARALRMQEINQKYIAKNQDYIMRLTSGGDRKLTDIGVEKFSDPDSPYPVIVTTSDLLTTGVDCKTCKVIAIDTNFGDNGMTKFKQIIGRGTRVREDYGKYMFTILDFRNASAQFADPNFNGNPVEIIEGSIIDPESPIVTPPNPDSPAIIKPNPIPDPAPPSPDFTKRKKIIVDGVSVEIINESVSFYGENGKLVTEKYTIFSKNKILQKCSTLESFLKNWTDLDKRKVIKEELLELGVDLDELRKEVNLGDIDDFDLICHIAYGQKPLTKKERARKIPKDTYFTRYNEKARKVLELLVKKYADGATGEYDLSDTSILKLPEFQNEFGSVVNIVNLFGGKDGWLAATQRLSNVMYGRVQ